MQYGAGAGAILFWPSPLDGVEKRTEADSHVIDKSGTIFEIIVVNIPSVVSHLSLSHTRVDKAVILETLDWQSRDRS